MSEEKPIKNHILDTLNEKSVLKQVVYDKTKDCFKIVKQVMQDIVSEYKRDLKSKDGRVSLEYRDRGMFEAELKVAGDLLIFNMHSNVFEFPQNHEIWKEEYSTLQPLVTYSGIINIYNFLADSFKYNRVKDLGYLIGRIFINKEYTFFIEGRRELGFNYPAFGKNEINYDNIREVTETAIAYALKFDLLVPPFNNVNIVSVSQMKEKFNKSRMQTGKRLGFHYNAFDDNKKAYD